MRYDSQWDKCILHVASELNITIGYCSSSVAVYLREGQKILEGHPLLFNWYLEYKLVTNSAYKPKDFKYTHWNCLRQIRVLSTSTNDVRIK